MERILPIKEKDSLTAPDSKDMIPWIIVLFLSLTVICYANAVFHPFVHDDIFFIQTNPAIRQWPGLKRILIPEFTPASQPALINPYYRPFLDVLYRWQYQAFGLNAYAYHAFNIGVHALNGILVFLLFLPFNWLQAALMAAFFLIHPVQTEAVACVAGISNLLFVFFGLLSLLTYRESLKQEDPHTGLGYYILGLMLFAAALLTKEQAIVVCLLVPLMEYFLPSEKEGKSGQLLRWTGYVVVALGYLWWRQTVTGFAIGSWQNQSDNLILRLLAIPRLLLTYVGLIVWPLDLHYYRCVNLLESWLAGGVGLFAVLVILYFMIRRWSPIDRSQALFGLGWFLIALLPALNLISLVNEYSLVQAAEHFLYFPLVGFLWFAMVMIRNLLRPGNPRNVTILGTVFCLILSFSSLGLTIRQNTIWRGEIPLFERTVRFEPEFGRARILLGKAYYFARRYPQAIEELQRALKIMEGYEAKTRLSPARRVYQGFRKGIYFDLAHCYEALENLSVAQQMYEKAMVIDPQDAVLYNNLGVLWLRQGQIGPAMKNFEEAFQLNPFDPKAATNLALCYIQIQQPKKALQILQRVLEKNSDFAPARQNLERLLQEEGK